MRKMRSRGELDPPLGIPLAFPAAMQTQHHHQSLELLASAVEAKDEQLEREETPERREQLLAEINVLAERFEFADREARID
jgi:hypothetical protein